MDRTHGLGHRLTRARTTFRCSTGSGPSRALVRQVDVRAHGGFIVAPGTRTSDVSYTAVGECREPALLPGWVPACLAACLAGWLTQDLTRAGHAPSPVGAGVTRPTAPVPPRAGQAVIRVGGGHSSAERLAGRSRNVRQRPAGRRLHRETQPSGLHARRPGRRRIPVRARRRDPAGHRRPPRAYWTSRRAAVPSHQRRTAAGVGRPAPPQAATSRHKPSQAVTSRH
ncbi:hypothetical protein E1292_24505 [Nonomuraea deserti]|uniref:DNA primase/polymerase bifunctional N-terminal domain-containing protein n=1 Tax=Nonomuraea deserti TaxID=1848322 RepID=A0A4V2YA26_9ACTN|nr:hypothetical protein E1292_24505 [Nonomuraea deserti]